MARKSSTIPTAQKLLFRLTEFERVDGCAVLPPDIRHHLDVVGINRQRGDWLERAPEGSHTGARWAFVRIASTSDFGRFRMGFNGRQNVNKCRNFK